MFFSLKRHRSGIKDLHARHHSAFGARTERYRAFENLKAVARTRIRQIANRNPALSYFSAYYTLDVAVGGGAGQMNDQQIEVLLGPKPFNVIRYGGFLGSESSHRGIKTLTEHGASLNYFIQDTGMIFCLLYPATREQVAWDVEMVHIDTFDPREALKGPHYRRLSKHLKIMAAYMAYTSLDGAPTLRQRLTYHWIHFTKPCRIEKKFQPRKVLSWTGKITNWVLTVGMSGAVLFLMQRWIIGAPTPAG